jgi:uncharacterized membrane protein (DUF2068 family)
MNCEPRSARAKAENRSSYVCKEEARRLPWYSENYLRRRGMSSPVTKLGLRPAQRRILRLVATFEFSKGIFVLLIGLTAILLVHKDAWVIAESLLALLHISPDRHSAQLFLDFADDITDARLWAAVRLAIAYSTLRFAEAYGLWRQRTWAEWVAFGSGTLLIPLEVRELMRGITLLRSTVFLGNLVIVFYMLHLLRSGRLAAATPPADPETPAGRGK